LYQYSNIQIIFNIKFMLTQLEIEELKNDGFTFEQIESIKVWLKNIDEWKTISEEDFWQIVKKDITNYFINKEKCIK
jgi:hypothetical protein